MCKRQGLFKEVVEKTERAINSEFETRRAEFARRIWKMHDRYIEHTIAYWQRDYDKWRTIKNNPEWNQEIENRERERQRDYCQWAIEDYEHGIDSYSIEPPPASVFGYDRVKITEPLVKRQPEDIAISMSVISLGSVKYNIYSSAVKNDLTKRGFDDIVESIDGLVKLCELLAKPGNHLQVKTRQRGQKAVQTRTVADMTNEMVQDLTELEKYTAYAKILQGRAVWKGKITTCALPEEPYRSGLRTLKDMLCGNLRSNIEERIRKRQENWKPEPEREGDVPKPVEEPKKPKKPKKDTDPESEPPPPRRPKNPRR